MSESEHYQTLYVLIDFIIVYRWLSQRTRC